MIEVLQILMKTQNLRFKTLKYIALILISFSCSFVSAQKRLRGKVIDAQANIPLPSVNVVIKGTSDGTATDFDGKFKIKHSRKLTDQDTVVFSSLGYRTVKVGIGDFKVNATIFMEENSEALGAVTINTKGLTSYEERLMNEIIKNKSKNDPNNIKKSQYLETSVLSVFLANIDDKITKKRRFKKSATAFIKDSDSTVMMPILLAKEIIRHRVDDDKNINNATVLQVQQEGTLDQLTSTVKTTINQRIAQDVNFYDENMDLLGRTFQSPISSSYKAYYKMYLSDSMMVDGVKHYKFEYFPRNEKSVAFDGSFWFESETFALTKIDATLPVEANVNFIKKLSFEVEYDQTEDQKWYVKSQKTNTDFSLFKSKKNKKSQYFIVQKQQKYSDFQLDFSETDSLENTSLQLQTKPITLEGNTTQLDSLEFKAIKGIRELKENNFIKFIDRFGAMTLTGYYNFNKIDLGPYFDLFYKNGIEGSRVTLPLRTSEKLSDKFTVGGYLGYGFKDKDVKYGFEGKWLLYDKKRTVLGFKYFDDFRSIARDRYIEFIKENAYSQGSGNILSVFTSNDDLNFRLLRRKHLDVTFTHEATENARYLFRPFYDNYIPNDFNKLIHLNQEAGGFRTVGMLFNLRYSKARNFDQQFFSRLYFGTPQPVYHFSVEVGNNKITKTTLNDEKSEFYARLNASVKKKFLLGSAFINFYMNVGYIFGEVPYPLLNNPTGNRSLGLTRFNYNLLNPTSFSSDVYTNMHLGFNGGGFIFNKIPLLSKLNLRESMSFKSFYGKLRDNHTNFFSLPPDLVKPHQEPYTELGIGVGNIFKLLQVEYVRRLNTSSFFNRFSDKGGIRFRLIANF